MLYSARVQRLTWPREKGGHGVVGGRGSPRCWVLMASVAILAQAPGCLFPTHPAQTARSNSCPFLHGTGSGGHGWPISGTQAGRLPKRGGWSATPGDTSSRALRGGAAAVAPGGGHRLRGMEAPPGTGGPPHSQVAGPARRLEKVNALRAHGRVGGYDSFPPRNVGHVVQCTRATINMAT